MVLDTIMKLKHVEDVFPEAWYELYERKFKLPFLYHNYYRSNSSVRKYLQYYKRPEKAAELLNIDQYKESKVLDIGCDWGYLMMLLKRRNPNLECHGIDIDSYSCEYGNRLARENKIKINLQYGNARKLPFDDDSFDYVVSTGTFEHILPEWRNNAVKEIRRVLKDGGRLVFLFPNPKGLAQRVKDFIAEKTPLHKFTMWIPNLQKMEKKYTKIASSDNEEDVYTETDSESIDDFTQRLIGNGFSINHKGAFIFMVEFIPNWLLVPSIWLEKIVESSSFLNRNCTTLFFAANAS